MARSVASAHGASKTQEIPRGIQRFNFAAHQFCDGFGEDNFCKRR